MEGSLVFQEPTKNVPMAASAIVLLVIGVYAVSTSQAKNEINVEIKVEVEGRVGMRNEAEFSDKEVFEVSKFDVESRGENEECKDGHAVFENPILAREISEINNVGSLKKQTHSEGILMTSNSSSADPLSLKNNESESPRGAELLNGGNNKNAISRDPKFHNNVHLNENEYMNGVENENIHKTEISCKKIDLNSAEYFQKIKVSFGAYFLCFGVGLCDGTLLVPFKLGNTTHNSILHVFRYLASFGISSIMVSPFLFLIYCVILNGRKIPSFHFNVAALPGVSSGVLWAAANFLSVHATFFLGTCAR
jgi:Transmembrane family, TMEM144 of transporters